MRFIRIISIAYIITLYIPLSAGIREVVFIGITGNGAPSMEQSFDHQLREQLSVEPTIYIADYVLTQHFGRLIRFDDYPVVSRKFVESIERLASDTTLFIWGQVYKNSVTPMRKNLVQAAIKGELEIGLTIYSLDRKEYAYAGKIHSEFWKSKGTILFGSPQTQIHTNALDKTELMDLCIADAVKKTVDIITAVIRNQTINDLSVHTATIETYKVPSISDVFSVHSIEARGVDTETIVEDTVKK